MIILLAVQVFHTLSTASHLEPQELSLLLVETKSLSFWLSEMRVDSFFFES
jgi:hypothetical protein